MKRSLRLALCFAASLIAFQAAAEDPVEIPDQYRIVGPATEKERPAALNGDAYTVVTPIFTGTEGNVSYLRLANLNSHAVTVTVTVVGSPTGRVYGAAAFTIPPIASKQYSYQQVLNQAGFITSYIGDDNTWSFYIRSSEDLTGFQHVIHNAYNKFFENMSVCTWDANFNYTGLNRALGNVHTTGPYMTEYPSAVMLHHYGAVRAIYRADVYASETGELKGGFNFYMNANESLIVPMSWYEDTVGWTPGETESHANIVFTRMDGPTFEAVPAHAVYNAELGAYLNMTQFCGINR